MRTIKIPAESAKYYYTENGNTTTIERCTLTLDHEVDRDALQAALARAARTYVQYGSRLAWKDGYFYYVPNDEPLVVHDTENEACVLGSADTNHYLYQVWAQGTTLGLTQTHGLSDGNSLRGFFRTLLYYYALELGMEVPAQEAATVVKEGEVRLPKEDPCQRFGLADVPPRGTPQVGPVFSVPEKFVDEDGELVYKRFVIRVPFAQLRDLARSAGSRISPLVMALEAQAMAKVWDTSGKALLGPITNDMRPLFGVDGVANFSSWIIAMIPAELTQADLPTQCAAVQQAMEMQNTEQGMRAQLGETLQKVAARSKMPLEELFSDEDGRRQAIQVTRQFVFPYVSNVAKFELPPSIEHILKDITFCVPSFLSTINLTIASAGETTTMCLTQTFQSDAFCKALVEEMRARGLDAQMEGQGTHAAPQITPDSVLRL